VSLCEGTVSHALCTLRMSTCENRSSTSARKHQQAHVPFTMYERLPTFTAHENGCEKLWCGN